MADIHSFVPMPHRDYFCNTPTSTRRFASRPMRCSGVQITTDLARIRESESFQDACCARRKKRSIDNANFGGMSQIGD